MRVKRCNQNRLTGHVFLGRHDLLYNVGVNVVLAAQEHGKAFGESAGPMNAPEGSTNCQPQVQKATATEYLLVNPAKQSNFIIGEVLNGGELAFIVENLPKDGTGCSGRWMFNQMMEHFGAAVMAIQGNWFGSNSDNLQELNQLTSAGMGLEAAGKQTWSGKRAREWGYTEIEVVIAVGARGQYSSVRVRFKK